MSKFLLNESPKRAHSKTPEIHLMPKQSSFAVGIQEPRFQDSDKAVAAASTRSRDFSLAASQLFLRDGISG